MPCFDYEEVECVLCGDKTQDGYIEFKGKIVCDEYRNELKEVNKMEELICCGWLNSLEDLRRNGYSFDKFMKKIVR